MGFLDFFSKKNVVGNVIADHYDTCEIVIQNPFDWVHTVTVFALYLDRLAHDIGGASGEALWRRLFFLASDIHDNVIRADSEQPLENRAYEAALAWRVVSAPTGNNRLRETLTLIEKGGHYFVECRTDPFSAPEPEKQLSQGCEAIFVHLFNAGSKEQKFFLPLVVIAQCNWYQENGLPGLSRITAAPYRGLSLMQQLLTQGG